MIFLELMTHVKGTNFDSRRKSLKSLRYCGLKHENETPVFGVFFTRRLHQILPIDDLEYFCNNA